MVHICTFKLSCYKRRRKLFLWKKYFQDLQDITLAMLTLRHVANEALLDIALALLALRHVANRFSRSQKHSIALCRLWGKFEMLSDQIVLSGCLIRTALNCNG
ncbi:hypothetical protein S245_033135, partial [Arachis hypogaea]